jgi:hypothetical protein
VLDQIDALPRAERERAAGHRHVQGDAGQHGLDVGRHVIGAFNRVHPAGVLRRQPAQRRGEIGAHVGIGVLLDDERRRGVAQVNEQHAVPGAGLGEEARNLAGDLDEALAGGADDKARGGDDLRRGAADGLEADRHGAANNQILFLCKSG